MERIDESETGSSGENEWTEEKNARRLELFEKKWIQNDITAEEEIELAELTRQVDARTGPHDLVRFDEVRAISDRIDDKITILEGLINEL